MKKALKIFGFFLLAVLLIVLCFAAYVQFSAYPVYPVDPPAFHATPDSVALAEGRRIVLTDCAYCHRGSNGKLDGDLWYTDPTLGSLYTANITRDSNAGIGAYTDGELAFLLRTGIKRDGHFAGPWMALPLLSDQDLNAVIAFLRSDAPEVQPSSKQQPPADLKFVGKMVLKVILKPTTTYPSTPVSMPSPDDKVAYGRYLATGRWECYRCHSASFETNNELIPEQSAGFFGGGNPITKKDDAPVLSANITPDPETGIGRWTEAQFAETIRFGKRPDGQPLSPAMPPMSALTDNEVSALWAYLQTVPPIHHAVQRTPAR